MEVSLSGKHQHFYISKDQCACTVKTKLLVSDLYKSLFDSQYSCLSDLQSYSSKIQQWERSFYKEYFQSYAMISLTKSLNSYNILLKSATLLPFSSPDPSPSSLFSSFSFTVFELASLIFLKQVTFLDVFLFGTFFLQIFAYSNTLLP